MIGAVLGNYRVVRQLGAGAMGSVYLAEHALMGRKAAVKTIHPELASDPENIARFLTEARSVNDIRHPNIVEVTDFGQNEDRYYLIMELLEGETLADRLDRVGVLPPGTACHIGAQVAAALGSAHEHGFVHRDLKPQNIFLTAHPDYPDYVKVLDFGITKLIGKSQSGRTQVGTILGTPHYMSPEQCMSDPSVDPRSDIYALGVVLYEMVTGTVPFSAETFAGLIMAHVSETPLPPAELNPDVPKALGVLIMRALEKAPEARWPTMRALRDGLLAVHRSSSPVPAVVAPAVTVALPARLSPPASPQPVRPSTPQSPTVAVVAAAEAIATASTNLEVVREQRQRVSSKLARIVIERIQSNTLVLPTIPEVALKCLDRLNDDRHKSTDLADTLARDPLLTTQVLKVANSVMFAGTGRVTTLDQAVRRLGDRQLKLILIELSARRVFESKHKRIRDAFQGMWEHSLAVGMLARECCKLLKRSVDEDSAYLAGLLHDAGKPMVAALLLEAEKNLSARDTEFIDDESFVEVVSSTHREVGAAVAESWRLPKEVLRAISLAGRYDYSTPHQVTNYVCLVNGLAKRAGFHVGALDAAAVDTTIDAGKALLGLTDDHLATLVDGLAERMTGRTDSGGNTTQTRAVG